MPPSARVRIRIRVEKDRAWRAQLIAPLLGIAADRLTEMLQSGAVYFGPYTHPTADALARAIRCFGVQCVVEKPVLKVAQPNTLRGTAQAAGRYVRRFVKRPVRRLA